MAAPASTPASAPAPTTAAPAPVPAQSAPAATTPAAPAVSNKLFVGNLSFKTRESDLAHAFEDACQCKVYVPMTLTHYFMFVLLACDDPLFCFPFALLIVFQCLCQHHHSWPTLSWLRLC